MAKDLYNRSLFVNKIISIKKWNFDALKDLNKSYVWFSN